METSQILVEPELKNILNELIKSLSKIIKIEIPLEIVRRTLEKFYDRGIKEQEVKLEMNFKRNENRIGFLETYTFDNIQGMTDELAEKMRKEISLGVINQESISSIQKRVKNTMDVGIVRARMIARTETNRAMNFGRLDAAKQSGLEMKKWISITLDDRTAEVSKAMSRKYGDPKKSIPLDKKFKVVVGGKVFEGLAPPFMPNDRDRLMTEVV